MAEGVRADLLTFGNTGLPRRPLNQGPEVARLHLRSISRRKEPLAFRSALERLADQVAQLVADPAEGCVKTVSSFQDGIMSTLWKGDETPLTPHLAGSAGRGRAEEASGA